MASRDGMRLGVVGVGKLGGAVAFALARETPFEDLVLVDAVEGLAWAQAEDIRHGLTGRAAGTVRAGTIEDLRGSDVVVFSLEPEITRPVWIHKKTGLRVSPHPDRVKEWSFDQKQWFSEHFQLQGLVPVERFRHGFSRLAADIKEKVGAHIIVFNCFTYDPADRTRNYFGIPDTYAMRALKFNLALIDISIEQGISIVDVDRILAELGGASHVTEAFRYSPQACDLIRDEFLRVLQDIGFFEHRPLVMQLGRKRA